MSKFNRRGVLLASGCHNGKIVVWVRSKEMRERKKKKKKKGNRADPVSF
jgi:hypothetical protein